MPEYNLTYRSVDESESLALDNLADILAENEVDEETTHRVMLSISEAYTNAYVHGNQKNPELAIKIRLTMNENQIHADITDEGKGGLERIGQIQPPGPLAEGGRGVALIRHYADEVTFGESDTGGLRVSVLIRREVKQHIK